MKILGSLMLLGMLFSSATLLADYRCVAKDNGWEEHAGGHAAYGQTRMQAERLALRRCEQIHGSCYIYECKRVYAEPEYPQPHQPAPHYPQPNHPNPHHPAPHYPQPPQPHHPAPHDPSYPPHHPNQPNPHQPAPHYPQPHHPHH